MERRRKSTTTITVSKTNYIKLLKIKIELKETVNEDNERNSFNDVIEKLLKIYEEKKNGTHLQ